MTRIFHLIIDRGETMKIKICHFLFLSCIFVFSGIFNSTSGQTNLGTANAQTVRFCDLAGKPDKYINKIVKISVVVRSALFSPTILSSTSCSEVNLVGECARSTDCNAIKAELDKQMRPNSDGVAFEAKVSLVGVLKKLPGLVYPVKGKLRSYSFAVREVKSRV